MRWLWLLVLVPILVNVASADATGWLDRLARRLAVRAAARLAEGPRERYEEEWLAELAALPGPVTRLAFAVRVSVRAGRLSDVVGDAKGKEDMTSDPVPWPPISSFKVPSHGSRAWDSQAEIPYGVIRLRRTADEICVWFDPEATSLIEVSRYVAQATGRPYLELPPAQRSRYRE